MSRIKPIRMLIALVLPMMWMLASCEGDKVLSYEDYHKWLNEPENGLVKERKVNALIFRVKYLPTEYLVHRELRTAEQAYSQAQIDSIYREYENGMHFLFSILPSEEGLIQDIVKLGITNYQEYKERVNVMNFGMQELMEMNADGVEINPVIVRMENVYGISAKRDWNVLFVSDAIGAANTYDLRFEDDIFYSGMHHFVFEAKNLEGLPKIKQNTR